MCILTCIFSVMYSHLCSHLSFQLGDLWIAGEVHKDGKVLYVKLECALPDQYEQRQGPAGLRHPGSLIVWIIGDKRINHQSDETIDWYERLDPPPIQNVRTKLKLPARLIKADSKPGHQFKESLQLVLQGSFHREVLGCRFEELSGRPSRLDPNRVYPDWVKRPSAVWETIGVEITHAPLKVVALCTYSRAENDG